jgi:hypothetical protein
MSKSESHLLKYQVVCFVPGRRVFARGVRLFEHAEALLELAKKKGYEDPEIVVEKPRSSRKT